jgi:hypothetical protein
VNLRYLETVAMNATHLGSGQLLFIRNRHAIEVDLVLAGPASVEGRPLVPGSPVAVTLLPPPQGWARRRLVRKLRAWAADALPCGAGIEFADSRAVLTLDCGGAQVRAPLTDLDVLFATDLPESST